MKLWRSIRPDLLTALMALALAGQPGGELLAQTQTEPAIAPLRKETAPVKQAGAETAYTLGLVTGPPPRTDFVIGQEIADVLAGGQETGPHGEVALRVLPMVADGGVRNIMDVVTLAGADVTIAPVVFADRLRQAKTFGDISNKLVYIAPLFAEEFHLLARPEIRSLNDLSGKTVSLGEDGSPGAVLGREVLNRLGVRITEVNLRLGDAMDRMRKGQIAASLLVSGKPITLLTNYALKEGIHFLAIPYSPALENQYLLQASLRHEDYPDLIATGESVDTIAVESALFAYNWPMRSERYRLLESFAQTLFSHFSDFLGEGHHPKWREANFAASLPGWQRFRPAERWLQRQTIGSATALRGEFEQFLNQNGMSDRPDREQLFQEFLKWRQRQ
jgi:uncharacterized protein